MSSPVDWLRELPSDAFDEALTDLSPGQIDAFVAESESRLRAVLSKMMVEPPDELAKIFGPVFKGLIYEYIERGDSQGAEKR